MYIWIRLSKCYTRLSSRLWYRFSSLCFMLAQISWIGEPACVCFSRRRTSHKSLYPKLRKSLKSLKIGFGSQNYLDSHRLLSSQLRWRQLCPDRPRLCSWSAGNSQYVCGCLASPFLTKKEWLPINKQHKLLNLRRNRVEWTESVKQNLSK